MVDILPRITADLSIFHFRKDDSNGNILVEACQE